jgi:hypothetical protein
MLARILDLEKVIIGKAISSDVNGTFSDVWGNAAVLAYVPLIPTTREEPSYGYTYTMVGHPMAEQPYPDKNCKSWVYPISYERAPVLSGINAGFLIQTPA